MLLIDDILLLPCHGLSWICREIHQAAHEELASEGGAITCRLRELYMMLETGQMSEADFDSEEKRLLDRLDEIEGHKNGAAGDRDEQEEAEEEYVTIKKR